MVVRRVKDTPPAELTRRPVAPAGLPATMLGTLTPEARAAVIRLAAYAGAVAGQLDRLITWTADAPAPAEATGD